MSDLSAVMEHIQNLGAAWPKNKKNRLWLSQMQWIHKKVILHMETLIAHLELLWYALTILCCFIIHSFIFLQAQSFPCHFLTTSVSIPSLITIRRVLLTYLVFALEFLFLTALFFSGSGSSQGVLKSYLLLDFLPQRHAIYQNWSLLTARPSVSIVILY